MRTARSPVDRRTVLAGLAAAGSGAAGCTSRAAGPDGTTVSVLAAGSLGNALENGLRPAVEADLQVEARGSARVARLVADGSKDPDVVAVADVALFDGPLDPAWYAEFATNSLVVAYNPGTDGGRRIADAGVDGWFRPLVDGDATFARTDPDLDPLGYRTLFALELATAHYGTEVDLRARIPRPDQLLPETQLVSRFETGAVDAAIAYRSMAVERGYDFHELPAAVDLSDPGLADRYATARYELPGGTVVRGAPISYGATARHRGPAVDDVFESLVGGQYLTDFGFVVPDDYPRYAGDAPDELAD